MKLKSVQELRELIDGLTQDIEFSYNGIGDMAICPYSRTRIEGYGSDGGRDFISVDDVLDNLIIDGKPLRDIATEIEILN